MRIHIDKLSIRSTTEEDWEILKTVRLESLLESPNVFSATYSTTELYSELQWRDRAAHKTQYHYILALNGQRAIGIIGGKQSTELEFGLIAMWVNPEFRGNGIADMLINAIKKLAISKGHFRIALSVSQDNIRAINLYSRHGFSCIADWENSSINARPRNQKMECVELDRVIPKFA